METIPLRPVFENKLFQDSKPIVKYAVLNAVYLLCTQKKTEEPIPKYLEPYLGLCNPSYYRNKDVCRVILTDVLPKIAKIKHLKYKSARKGHIGNVKKAIIRKEMYNRDGKFSDENEINKTNFAVLPPTHEETAWNKGQFDPIMRKMALQNNEVNKGKKKLFYDKPKD